MCIRAGIYYVPGRAKSSMQRPNSLVKYILTRTVRVLDWKPCSLDPYEIAQFVKYVKSVPYCTASKESKLVIEAFRQINTEHVNTLLEESCHLS